MIAHGSKDRTCKGVDRQVALASLLDRQVALESPLHRRFDLVGVIQRLSPGREDDHSFRHGVDPPTLVQSQCLYWCATINHWMHLRKVLELWTAHNPGVASTSRLTLST